MFGVKKLKIRMDKWGEIYNHNNREWEKELEKVIKKDDYVECSTCGCLVKRDKAEKVQEMVDKIISTGKTFFGAIIETTDPNDKEIKTSYYCKRCYEKNTTEKKINRKK